MTKLLLAILLLFSTIAVVAHGIMVYQLAKQETLIAEEDTSEEKSPAKEGKEISDEKIPCTLFSFDSLLNLKLRNAALMKLFITSKGFNNKPYNPPEAA